MCIRPPEGGLKVKTSNPVLARLGQAAERERAAGYAAPGAYGQQPDP